MKRALLLFAGISLCCAALGSQAEKQPPATRVEHFFVASDEAQALFTFFKDTFHLPEVWPFKVYGNFSSGGLSLGNVVLEFALLPGRDNEPRKTQFQGIAFEPKEDAEATRLELTKRNIPFAGPRTSGPQAPGRHVRVGWEEAEKFLKERQLLVKDVGHIAISPKAIEGLSIRLVEADQAREPAHPLLGPGQGTGQGVDHVGIAVCDFKKTRYDYEQALGFKVKENPPQPNGWLQSVIWFENATYLEFQPIAALPWIAEMFDYTDGYADFAEKYEGAVFLGLATSSAKYASDHLKARNFQACLVEEDPAFNYVHISHEPLEEKQAFPLAIFFIEYAFDPGRPARLAARLEQGMMTHPNTARRLHSVWFAVRDMEASLKNIQDAGFEPGETREARFLGAKGREAKAGDGYMLLLQSVDKNGVLAKFLSDRHDGEIIGVSVEVSDVEKARSLIESRSGQKLEPYDGFYGRSILIPPDMTHGVWMELFQR